MLLHIHCTLSNLAASQLPSDEPPFIFFSNSSFDDQTHQSDHHTSKHQTRQIKRHTRRPMLDFWLTRFTSYIISTMCITRINVTIRHTHTHTESVYMNADQWNVGKDSVNQLEHWYNSDSARRWCAIVNIHPALSEKRKWKLSASETWWNDGWLSFQNLMQIQFPQFCNIVRCICISVTYTLYVWAVDI